MILVVPAAQVVYCSVVGVYFRLSLPMTPGTYIRPTAYVRVLGMIPPFLTHIEQYLHSACLACLLVPCAVHVLYTLS